MTSSVCVFHRGNRKALFTVSWSQWCLRPIKCVSHQNLRCTLEMCPLCTALYHHTPWFLPKILNLVSMLVCLYLFAFPPSGTMWDFLADKECAPLISPRLMGFLPQFLLHICPHSCWSWLHLHRDTCSNSSLFQLSVLIIWVHWFQTQLSGLRHLGNSGLSCDVPLVVCYR